MALQKQTVEISFHKGLDTKTDPFRLSLGNFVSMTNSVFDKLGRLSKRNGFGVFTELPIAASFLTTFNGNLTAIGSSLQAYSKGSNTWVDAGDLQPLRLTTLPLIRNSINQTQADAAVSSNNLVCTAWSETNGSTVVHKYAVADAITGQNVIAPTALAADATYGAPRVFVLGTYFVVVYTNHPGAYNLKYVAINTVNLAIGPPVTISTSVDPATTQAFDGVVYNNTLYVAWNGGSASGVKLAALSSILNLSNTVTPDVTHVATVVSVAADATSGAIWVSYYDLPTTDGYTFAVQASTLTTILAPTAFVTSGTVLNLTSSADSGVNTIFYEVENAYSYDAAIKSNLIKVRTCAINGTLGTAANVVRSVGLASKAFVVEDEIYLLAVYSSPYQSTYFLVNASESSEAAPVILAKLAYSNGGGYLTTGLPSVSVNGTSASIAYLIKDLIQSANKNTNIPSGSQVAGVYSQTGINLVSFDLTTDDLSAVEIGSALQISGGFMWMYDGYLPVEQNFFLYPDSVEVTTATTGGFLKDQTYFYQALYEWADNQGNIHRSAASIPVSQVTTGGNTSANTVKIPTLRLTYKIANPVKIVIYRWSTAQPVYYQATSISAPVLNSLTADSVSFVDTLADASILGNNIIYTNGGVVENMNAPSPNALALFDTRVWMIDGEDPNLLRFSKQVIEATPVEMSDLFTFYVAPSSSVQRSSGILRCLFPMDDKLVLFKTTCLYYINGRGPDNTGANNEYSEPVFITSPVGCENQNSIVLVPKGLMFQSTGGGIWLLNRALELSYIGAPVEAYKDATVLSALTVPGTNRVIFTLDSGISLSYDYFVEQWGDFVGIPGISSTIYEGLHTYMSPSTTVTPPNTMPYTVASQVYQETPGEYLDGANPVLMSFTTGWINLAGLQGYKRAYWMELLGTYISPHTLSIGVAYDFNPAIAQRANISPDNFASGDVWGGTSGDGGTWGFTVPPAPWGGGDSVEQWQINFQQQSCQSFQISLNEYYDSTLGPPAGAGLTISSLELVVGLIKGYPRNIPANHRTG